MFVWASKDGYTIRIVSDGQKITTKRAKAFAKQILQEVKRAQKLARKEK